jgi:ankyrin repeat protein
MEDVSSVLDPWGSSTNIDSVTLSSRPHSSTDDVNSHINSDLPVSQHHPMVRSIIDDTTIPESEKRNQLQDVFSRAASNGDVRCIESILKGNALKFIDIDAEDEDGITPLIHGACFGHVEVVRLCNS